MHWIYRSTLLVCLLLLLPASAQNTATDPATLPNAPQPSREARDASEQEREGWLSPGADPQNELGLPLVRHLASDQKQFWTTPMRLNKGSLRTLLPFAAFTGVLLASDDWLSRQVPDKPDQIQRSRDISNYAAYSLIAAGGGAFVWGHLTHNDQLHETGLLSGEAAINAAAIDYLLKGITQRPRPFQNQGSSFFQGGASFPSEHSAAAWSIASVVAHEYPGLLSQLFAYGFASTVTLTRVTGREHFPADAFIGSALGWYFGRQVYRAHHDPLLGGGAWGGLLPDKRFEATRDPRKMGSPEVPLDSWVYPAIERLAALGYIQSAYLGMRPWTRMECARFLEEAQEKSRGDEQSHGEAGSLYEALVTEFADETARLNGSANLAVSLDSLYTRVMGISGKPLRDGYHFGQTVINDYGRPYTEGVNEVSGLSGHAVAGPLDVSLQGEYQHAPAVLSDPLTVLQATAAQDGTLPLGNGHPPIDRFTLLNGSIGYTFRNTRISFGKQTLEMGPGIGGQLLLSNNAEAIPMLRIEQVSPVEIPGISKLLGSMRAEFFLGQLSGQHWAFSNSTLFGPNISPQPFIHGTKLSFKPTTNLEFGFGATVVFGGPDLPFTWHNFLRTFYSNAVPGTASDAGDRRSTFDFNYRVPYLRDWMTIYADSLVEDEVSPLGSTRPTMRLGMYFPKLPKIPKLDLRLEGVYSDVPGQQNSGFIYSNGRYRSGYTNNGVLLADWIGRQGRGGQGWATYWLSPRSKIQLAYRHVDVAREFIGGGRLNDFGGNLEWMLRPDLALSGLLQYEQWKFPVLSASAQSNVTASVQLTLYPHWGSPK